MEAKRYAKVFRDYFPDTLGCTPLLECFLSDAKLEGDVEVIRSETDGNSNGSSVRSLTDIG